MRIKNYISHFYILLTIGVFGQNSTETARWTAYFSNSNIDLKFEKIFYGGDHNFYIHWKIVNKVRDSIGFDLGLEKERDYLYWPMGAYKWSVSKSGFSIIDGVFPEDLIVDSTMKYELLFEYKTKQLSFINPGDSISYFTPFFWTPSQQYELNYQNPNWREFCKTDELHSLRIDVIMAGDLLYTDGIWASNLLNTLGDYYPTQWDFPPEYRKLPTNAKIVKP